MMDRDYDYEDTMPQNRDWYERPYQGNGRDHYGYGHTDLDNDGEDAIHALSRSAGWLVIAAVMLLILWALWYIAGHPA